MSEEYDEEEQTIVDIEFLAKMKEEDFADYINARLDLNLEQIRNNVYAYEKARVNAQLEENAFAVFCFRVMASTWIAAYEVCRRIESSPLGLTLGGQFGREEEKN